MLPKAPSGAARKRIVFVLGALLAVNAAVAHIVTAQITSVAFENRVKDDQVVVEEASPVEDSDAGEEGTETPSITVYTVKAGDTISTIAQKFGVSQNTILWANEMTAKSVIKPGQALVILPINGIQYTVKKGDTISGIAAKFDADAEEILYFNDLDDPKKIQPGVELIIPDAEPVRSEAPKKQAPAPQPKQPTTSIAKTAPAAPAPQSAFSEEDTHDHSLDEKQNENEKEDEKQENTPSATSGRYGMFVAPAPGSVLTQGYHAVNAVDFGAKAGSPIVAAAEGTVIVAKGGCPLDGSLRSRCNGGFGNFVVIAHPGGIQTLYAHLSKVSVSVGDSVDQGDAIGGMGDSGRSTGTHLHFETHGIKNPFTKDKKFTKY